LVPAVIAEGEKSEPAPAFFLQPEWRVWDIDRTLWPKEQMMKVYLIVFGLLTFVVSPALAKEYWVAQDPVTKKCDIVNAKPDGHTKIMIGPLSYATKEEAKAARAKTTAEECPHKPSSQ
jgi:hypothetical protein